MIPQTQRYLFLTQKQVDNLTNYFLEQYKNRWLAYSDDKFNKLKAFQALCEK